MNPMLPETSPREAIDTAAWDLRLHFWWLIPRREGAVQKFPDKSVRYSGTVACTPKGASHSAVLRRHPLSQKSFDAVWDQLLCSASSTGAHRELHMSAEVEERDNSGRTDESIAL